MTFLRFRLILCFCLLAAIALTGCQSWRDGISEYSGECYDSTCNFFNEVAIDFKLKDRAKYVRQPYSDEVKVSGDSVELTYSPRIGRLTTLRRSEGENMLHILDPREERKLVENQEVPVYGGGVLLYNLAPKKALSGQRYEVTGDKLRLLSGNTEALLVVDKKKSEMQYLYRCEAGKGDSVAARLEFKKPQCIVFEDSSGRIQDDRIIRIRPKVCYYAPPKGDASGVISISASWIVILYKEDMIIMSRKSCFRPGDIDYQFQFRDGNLVLDSIIPETYRSGGKLFIELWQIFFRPALYSPKGLTDFLLSNHINKLK